MSDVDVVDEVPAEVVREVLALIETAAREDGQPAVSEQGRLQLRGGPREGVRHLLLHAGDGTLAGYAQLEDTDPVEAPVGELVVTPVYRGNGYGRRLGQVLLDVSGKRLRVWAHGGHPAARHLTRSLGLTLFRELRQLRRPLMELDLPEPVVPEGARVRTFRPGEDDAAWLALNSEAFAHHPEQGGLTQRDLDDRKAEPWFDPSGFFLAERDGELVGFHWTKVHEEEELGEVYVVGVSPREQGGGLGKALTAIGLRYLSFERGLPTAMLYVDADNAAAVRVYEGLGFRTHEVDLMYRSET
ncbi:MULTISPECIES: mycothiol synthase [unclassified Streptomyces]|uniref:mycothiol synthase n=1 Tax=unclassified Streptomyces TaxID=2593676 RepID=UPI002DDB7EE3|nr:MULTISPECIES: mycothiol synthase [unclassified Streptomyces]WSA93895.1 mycothiol synthase [Streptomyces sp. NBC_01795]WSB78265.1 mycothiol synthase [Streptomyces sp. NBC_01775]WSS13479.1 mycothiol synthase [Streptomyces sp. NBC_01186]WSS42277.1 mycothiol synthase [Streptomyces sp. NBC_01187]